MTSANTPPGWYPAPGDPPGTHRYWNGSEWTTGPTQMGQTMPSSGGTGTVHGKLLADPWARIGARLIDGVILVGIGFTLLVAVFFNDDDFDRFADVNIGFIIVGAVLGIAYEVGFVAWKGGTPGKLILGLRIVQADDGTTPPSLRHAFLRWVPSLAGNLPGVLGFLAGMAVLVLSLIWLFTDPKRQTVYDKVASTYVVKA